MSARQIVSDLGGRWYGTYGTVPCVVHADSRPSLRIRDGDEEGRLLVSCYVGCNPSDILVELRQRGLLNDGVDRNYLSGSRQVSEA